MKKIFIPFLMIITTIQSLHAAEQAETERMLRTVTPPSAIVRKAPPEKDVTYFDSFYETSDIIQGNRTGHWSELTNQFGYTHGRITGYFFVSELERFDNKDYTANLGYYFNFKNSYLHLETAFAWQVDYIYKFQNIAEYGHKLIKDLYWQMGYSYRYYDTGDTHLVYPELIYYFGDSYMSATWGVSYIEDRDTAQFGSFRGNFAITNFLNFIAGVAVGQRLYDIYGLDAHEEFGYILFTGLNFKVYKGISARVGYSYSTEAPKFIKRSLNFGLSVKF